MVLPFPTGAWSFHGAAVGRVFLHGAPMGISWNYGRNMVFPWDFIKIFVWTPMMLQWYVHGTLTDDWCLYGAPMGVWYSHENSMLPHGVPMLAYALLRSYMGFFHDAIMGGFWGSTVHP